MDVKSGSNLQTTLIFFLYKCTSDRLKDKIVTASNIHLCQAIIYRVKHTSLIIAHRCTLTHGKTEPTELWGLLFAESNTSCCCQSYHKYLKRLPLTHHVLQEYPMLTLTMNNRKKQKTQDKSKIIFTQVPMKNPACTPTTKSGSSA